ncbi:hemerythrin domain-containing protein [Jannaschia seohaensis]|uniref:Hemerythrin-like domain-containing protein n=1 Tax=Jannaschia seohaensis TaxID=475081 RepID=A0A2Y9ASN9_9RHOB|nr:hemerythrin domain-containing protein [Jannaschia seohaensis]PWJ17397.1 hemerythrin-like domain-containing protein [Jannaschia seohaensis]SSA47460.1 Hemerythrin-like domain-containing protein [Jannaschia seohaensis]
MTDLSLDTRDSLPEALRALVGGPARPDWASHPEFGPLTQFWLERHMMFRKLLEQIRADATARADGKIAPEAYDRLLMQRGGLFLNELNGHHGIEDQVYFPKMVAAAPQVARAFELLDADHHELHEEIEGFAADANALLRRQAGAAALEARMDKMARFLDRHLTDEEDVVVPVILRVGERHLG